MVVGQLIIETRLPALDKFVPNSSEHMNRQFNGVDTAISDKLALDVAADEEAIVDAIAALRREASSFESIAYLLRTDPGQVSRYLRGESGTTLTNYLRIARIFGYRCKKSSWNEPRPPALATALWRISRIGPHQV